jgi:hypothetical protein
LSLSIAQTRLLSLCVTADAPEPARIMPAITSGNTHATVVAIAEDAAGPIKKTHSHASREAVTGRA